MKKKFGKYPLNNPSVKTSGKAPATEHGQSDAIKIAVVIHLFYEDQWPDFQDVLNNFETEFSLFVTLPPESRFGDRIRARYPDAVVLCVPNLGRDVAPFLSILHRLCDFDAVCKLHTKRTEGRYAGWRRSLLAGLLGSGKTIQAYLDAFESEPALVLAGPRDYYVDGVTYAIDSMKALALQHGALPYRYGFFAGTMFWCRPKAFAELAELYPQDCFVAHCDGDGQPEHVVERAFDYIASAANKKVMLWDGEVEIAEAPLIWGNTNFESTYWGSKERQSEDGQPEHQASTMGRPSLCDIHQIPSECGRV